MSSQLLTESIIKSSFEVMNELGSGFLESVYKNALVVALRQNNLVVEVEKPYQVFFRDTCVGIYVADIVVNNEVIVELKCCKALIGQHMAQTINYLVAANLPTGLLINFGNRAVEYKRLHHPNISCRPFRGDLATTLGGDPAGVSRS